MSDHTSAHQDFTRRLRQHLGTEGFSDDPEQLELMGQDIWTKGTRPAFVAAPASTEELAVLTREAYSARIPLNPRGGGMSYTKGYTPDRQGVGVIDFRRMDRILTIDELNMTVTVEAGCTWKTLYEALDKRGLRTPFFGPLSGLSSTVGGGVSQNNAFFGAGRYGPTSESVVALAVVLGDGTILRTGTASAPDVKPFFRHYGPDLTGLFLGDAGAFGHKAEITLRLIPKPLAEAYASFEFETREACARAMQEVARTGVPAELFGFDPNLTRVRMKRASLASDAKTLSKVVGGQGGLLKGLREGARIAAAGRSFIAEESWSLHMTVEGGSEAGAKADLASLRTICRRHDGKEVADTIPKVIRANPFTPLNNMLGPEGERWVPIHGIVAMEDGPACWQDIEDLFESHAGDLDTHGVQTGFLVTSLSTNGYLIEPVFLWPEERFAIHDKSVEAEHLRKLKRFPANPGATDLVSRLREEVLDIFGRYGAAHFQIGRTYRYLGTRDTSFQNVLERIKEIVDPDQLINPGALGLAAGGRDVDVRNPRTGEIERSFASASAAEVRATTDKTRKAARAWVALTHEERASRLTTLADNLERNGDDLRTAVEEDTGRRRIASLEVDGVIASLRGWASLPLGETNADWTDGRSNPQIRHRPQMVPYGVVGVISPWNFPLTLSMIDTVPALLAGCAVVLKPSEVTPRFAEPLRALIEASGFSDVFRIVMGDGTTGSALVDAVDAVCFTGSVATGRKVAERAARNLIPAFLELGGKDPLIVTASADLEAAADAALRGSVLASGQACQSIERIYVHRSVHDDFVRLLAERAEKAELNTDTIDHGEIGPLIFANQADILEAQIADAKARGARVLTGGEVERRGGFWLRPTVLADVDHTMLVMTEESFGPLMPVMAFDDVDEAIRLANDSAYGLSAAVFAGSLEEAETIGRQIEAGAVSLNDAALTSLFHEAEKQSFKHSGLGASRMGRSGFERFFRKKALIAQTGSPLPLSTFSEGS